MKVEVHQNWVFLRRKIDTISHLGDKQKDVYLYLYNNKNLIMEVQSGTKENELTEQG